MIITRLAGGLGNQLFQWAASSALRASNEESVILFTQSLAQYSAARVMEISRFFELPNWIRLDTELGSIAKIGSIVMHLRPGRFLPGVGVNDANFSAELCAASKRNNRRVVVLDGYFQRNWPWPAFDSARREIADCLRVSESKATFAEEYDCVLHVRGGDFLTNDFSKVVGPSFYANAVAELKRSTKVDSIYVVTDDISYAKIILSDLSLTFPQIKLHIPETEGDMQQDFMILLAAKARIISAGTFAWWAAALDPKAAITIAPQQWLRGLNRTLFLPWERLIAS